MTVSVTMEQIIDFRNSSDFLNGLNLPLKAAYKITKIKRAVEDEYKFYSEKFQALVEEYARKDENGNIAFSEDGSQILIKDGMIEECNKALNDLQGLQVDIDNYNLTIDDLGDDVTCTPEQLSAIMPFLS